MKPVEDKLFPMKKLEELEYLLENIVFNSVKSELQDKSPFINEKKQKSFRKACINFLDSQVNCSRQTSTNDPNVLDEILQRLGTIENTQLEIKENQDAIGSNTSYSASVLENFYSNFNDTSEAQVELSKDDKTECDGSEDRKRGNSEIASYSNSPDGADVKLEFNQPIRKRIKFMFGGRTGSKSEPKLQKFSHWG